MSGVDKEGAGVLYLIGLGLGDEKDITVAGLEVVKRCRAVYLEAYTSILGVEKSSLEVFYGRPVELMDREAVEQECDSMLEMAKTDEVAFLVVGDVYGATTHTDIAVRARDLGVKVKVIHNASIMNACGACGLQLYNFGQTVSICFFTETWRPDSFIDKVLFNKRAGLHTLCLLDIKVKEQSEENMARGRKIYEPPRFMTVNQSLEQILEVLERRPDAHDCLSPDTLAVGLARVGQTTQCIASGPMRLLKDYDFGGPLHSMIIPGDMHYLESDMLRTFDIVGNPFAEEASEATGASAAHATSVAAPAEASAPAATEEATPQEGALEALEAAVGRRETIAELAVRVMGEADPDMKAAMTLRLRELWMAGKIKPPAAGGGPTAGLQAEPARPAWVKMVDARKLKQGSKVAFVHSLCHAESYAIDLMWDIVARFAHERLPEEFFDDWTRVAADEARHYSLWRARLKQLGSDYGHLTVCPRPRPRSAAPAARAQRTLPARARPARVRSRRAGVAGARLAVAKRGGDGARAAAAAGGRAHGARGAGARRGGARAGAVPEGEPSRRGVGAHPAGQRGRRGHARWRGREVVHAPLRARRVRRASGGVPRDGAALLPRRVEAALQRGAPRPGWDDARVVPPAG